jgi:aryl-alcohol dehydrogenase-like predicted oxidoreductase
MPTPAVPSCPRRAIPGTDLQPSVICLGTAPLGSIVPRDDAFRLLDAFVEAGGTFLDSAHIYADWLGGERSVSEKTIGAWMRSRGCRGTLVLGTKGAHPEMKTMRLRLSAPEIATDLEESLEYLGVDRIDLYWLHRDDPSRPVGEILGVLEEHASAGRIRFYGASNWTAARLAEARAHAERAGIRGFVASQNMWSLARPVLEAMSDRTMVVMGREEIAYHRKHGMAAVPFSSQAGGLFAKMERGVEPPPVYRSDENRRRFERAREIADRHGRGVNDVALAYLLSQDFPVFPIVGPRSPEQLASSMGAAGFGLLPDELGALEQGL